MPKKMKARVRTPAQRAFDRGREVGYQAAIAALVQCAYEGIEAPFRRIEALGEAKRGGKLPRNGDAVSRFELESRAFQFYWKVKQLIERKGLSPKAAIAHVRGNPEDSLVKQSYYRYLKWDRAGKLFPDESEAQRLTAPYRQLDDAISAMEVHSPK